MAGQGSEKIQVVQSDARTELSRLPQWLVWRFEERDGRVTKVPYDAKHTGSRAAADRPATWASYAEAVACDGDEILIDGLGFVFTKDDPYTGIDIDDCRDPETGAITEEAQRWIDRLDSYTEVSPSGTGVKCWVRGRVPRGIHPEGWGIFSERRYFCFTGEHLEGTPETIEERQAVLDELYRSLAPEEKHDVDAATQSSAAPVPLDDTELIERICASRNGFKFRALWEGHTAGYASSSEADLALCSMLAFWTGGDSQRIDRLFRRSGLYRPKWEREDYRKATIARGVKGKTEFYSVGDSEDEQEGDPAEAQKIEPYRPFPVDALPGIVGEYVRAASEAIGCDPAYLALPMLSALGAAIGNTRRLALKRGWSEPAVVWTCIVGDSGTMKSPALELALRPLRKRQHQAMKEYAEAMERYREEKLLYDKELARWKRSSRGGLPPTQPEQPVANRSWCDDSTIEALAVLLQQNWRGLLMVRDELSGWLRGFDRYSQGRGEVAKWLEVFGGRAMVVDRKTGVPPTIYIPRAAVSVAGGIQPTVLQDALNREYFENGLAARLLLAYCPRRTKRWTEADIDPVLEDRLEEVFNWLYSLRPETDEGGDDQPRVVELSPAAKEAWIEFYNEHAGEQVELEGDLAAAWSKLEGYAARLALVVHHVRWATRDLEVGDELLLDERSVEAGVQLARWFGFEARRIYSVLGESEAERERRRLVELIARKGGTVTARDLMEMNRHRFPRAAVAREALDELVRTGVGEWEEVRSGVRGRQTRRFRLFEDR